MNDWIGLAFFVVLVVGAIICLKVLAQPRKITAEEFEKRAAEGSGMMKTGMIELQKILDPSAKKSIEVVQDLKGGKFDKKQAKDSDSEQSAVSGKQ